MAEIRIPGWASGLAIGALMYYSENMAFFFMAVAATLQTQVAAYLYWKARTER